MTADGLRQRLEARSDDELLEILRARDEDEWQPEVFPIVEDILRQRGVGVAEATAPAESVEDEADQPMVLIARFRTSIESDACRSALDAAGFHVLSADEYTLRVDPALSPVLGGLRLMVPGSEAEDARAFLAAADDGQLSAGLIQCASCGSTDIGIERDVSRSGTLVNTLFSGVAVPDVTITYRCRACGTVWE